MDVESVIQEIQKLSSEEKRRVEKALRASKANGLSPALSQGSDAVGGRNWKTSAVAGQARR